MPPHFHPDRRRLLSWASASSLGLQLFGRSAWAATDPALARRKLVVVICRGGMDGLSLAPPVGDKNYADLRGAIALGDDALPLDETFSLHPSLTAVHALAKAGEARIAPAVSGPDQSRSHFEAQDVLESGASAVYGAPSGWLNRAVESLAGVRKIEALSVGAAAPLILRGKAEAASWSPGRAVDTQIRLPGLLQDLYRDDPLLGPALARGMATEAMAQTAMTDRFGATGANATRPGAEAARDLGATLAGFMREPSGPQIAAMSLDVFDTHANQGAAQGQLAARFATLDATLDGLHRGLGAVWRDTVVVVVTEFGRTAKINGTNGTDHGSASTAVLLGGGLKPGGIVGDWPGLRQADLYEGRDLRPTLDLRRLFKGVLADHMSVDRRALDTQVFPDSLDAPPLPGLIRSA